MTTLSKTINGKTFNFLSREFNKDFAKNKAKKQREQGNYARVFYCLGNYVVYVCQK